MFEDNPGDNTVAPKTGGAVPADARGLSVGECEWCTAPFPEAGALLVARYAPDGELYEVDVICESCDRYGPPGSSRRDRREWAERLSTNWSRLERLGWALIGWANR